MPENNVIDWDSVVGASPPDPTATAILNNAQIAANSNPDTEAKYQDLAKFIKAPIQTVRAQPDVAQQTAAPRSIDANDIALNSPVTAQHLGNQETMHIAKDDIGNMRGLEDTTKGTAVDWDTVVGGKKPPAETDLTLGTTTNPMGQSVTNYQPSLGQQVRQWINSAFNIPERQIARAQNEYAQKQLGLPRSPDDLLGQFAGSLTKSASFDILPNVYGDPRTGAGEVAAGLGNLAGFVSGPAKLVEKTVAKGAERLGINIFEHTVTESFAKALARDVSHGALTLGTASALGQVGDALDSPDLQSAVDKTVDAGVSGAETGGVFGAAGRVFPDNNWLSTVGRILATNTAVDVTQGTNPNDNRSLEKKVYDYALNTFFSLHGSGRAPGGFFRDAAKADIALNDQTIPNITQLAEASKVRVRNPDTFQTFMEDATRDGPVEALYLSPDALQQAGINPLDLVKASPQLAETLPMALSTGSDIKIPTADYATNIAGTPLGQTLIDHLKTDPNGMSRSEANYFMQTQGEQLQAEIAKALQEKEGDDTFSASRQAVHSDVMGQLTKAARFTPDVNEAYALLHSNFNSVMAARMGVTPEEFYQKYGAKIIAEDINSPGSSADYLNSIAQKGLKQGDTNTTISDDNNGTVTINYNGDKVGEITYYTDESGRTRIKRSDVETPGEGIGTAAYAQFIRDQLAKGNTVGSDADVSAAARRVYEKLTEQGFNVTKAENTRLLANYRETTVSREDAKAQQKSWPTVYKDGVRTWKPGSNNLKGEPVYTVSPNGTNILKQGVRGAYDPNTRTLALLKAADLSTFLHESGHFFLDTLNRVAVTEGVPEEIKVDMDSTLKWFGTEGATSEERLANWNKMSLDEQRDSHEKFARGFEKYLFEGKSPSLTMQGVFQRFRAWLLNVYRNLLAKHEGDANKAMRVELSPDVRQVFDRMLATADEIKNVEAMRNLEPLFKTAGDAGMTDEQFKAYHDLGVQATQDAQQDLQSRALRDMKWLSNARGRELKRLQADAENKRKAVRAEVTDEVMNEPINRAKTFFKRGEVNGEVHEGPHRLDIDAVRELAKDMYGDGADAPINELESRYGKYGLLGRDGIDPEFAAEMFGYSSARDLLHDMLNAENPRDKIAGLTDQRMLERYGDLTSPTAMERAADEAVVNDARMKFLATEANALNAAVGGKKILTEAARSIAGRMIDALKIRNVRPDQYATQAARAARNADAARGKNDLAKAAFEKRNQLIQSLAQRAAMKAQEDIEKGLSYFDKFNRKSVRENISSDYINQIDALLDRFDLRKGQTLKAIDKRKSLLEWVQEQNDKGLEPAIDAKLLDEAQKMHFRDMSVESFRGLLDAVKSIEHLGRMKQKLLDIKDMREFNAVVADAQAAFDKLPKLEQPTERNPGVGGKGMDGVRAALMKVQSSLKSGDASLLKIEQMCDWLDKNDPNGVFNRIVFRRIAEAQGKENDLQLGINGKLREAYAAMPDEVKADLNTRYTLPELVDSKTGQPLAMLKKEILALAMNTANESNYQKLLRGENWTDENVRAVLDRVMSKGDIEFVNKVISTVETLWPHIQEMETRLSGVAPPKIEGRPFNLKNGTIDGGYYPIVYDPLRSYDADTRNQKAGDKLFENNYTRATTDKGHTIAREEGYAKPLLLSLDVIPSHLSQVIHDLSYREAVIDSDRFLSDKRIRAGIEGALGREYYKQFRPWLQGIANDRVIDTKGLRFWDNVAHSARTSATMVGLGYRLSTMLVHGATAASNSIGEVGPKYMAVGCKAFFGSPEKMAAARDFVFERSGEMRHRMNDLDRDIRDSLRELDQTSSKGAQDIAAQGINTVKKFAYHGIAMLDMGSAMPTWIGAYQKAIDKPERGGLGMSETDAGYYADKAVRNAHGGGGPKDLSAIQRGSETQKLFTMFYSFWNHFYNRQRDLVKRGMELPETFRTDPKQGGKDLSLVLSRSFFYFVAPQIIHALLKPSTQEEQNPALWAIEEIGLGLVSGIPVARDIANSMFTGRDYVATPAAQVVTNLLKSFKDAKGAVTGEGASDKWVSHTIQNAGYVFGLPTGQVATSGQFLWDVIDGDQTPQNVQEWLNGVVYGKTKPKG